MVEGIEGGGEVGIGAGEGDRMRRYRRLICDKKGYEVRGWMIRCNTYK